MNAMLFPTPEQTDGTASRPAAHAPSYYAATANPHQPRPPLKGAVSADVCIVGAGFTGISAALHLAEQGMKVVVLEAAKVGWGASGRNGGQIVNGYSRDLETIRNRYGRDAERALGDMSLEGAAIIRERVARYQIQCDLRDGGFVAAFSHKQMRELEEQKTLWEQHGHHQLQMIDREAMAGIVKTDRYVGGRLDKAGGHLHPLNLVLGEAAACEYLGGAIYEDTPACRIQDGARPVVVTPQGRVEAAFVLVCGNAYLARQVAPGIHDQIMPVSTQVITTEQLPSALLKELLPADNCVEDHNYILDYYRRTADNRLLYGGGSVYGGSDPADIPGKILPNLYKTFPKLKGVKVDFAWSGNFALTLSRIPSIGRIQGNVYYSHGDSGHGVTTTHLLGRLLAEAVAGQAKRFDSFTRLPSLPFPGGHALRVPLCMIGAWYYGLRDKLGI
ncbi:MAG TPA: FAD-binding oxidoreductase [Candidatus Sulfotelmatobacter sp.]|nr:FAD-binding oxidoreductase [Candidatus Sulfotelmatobacter sp.]